MSTSLRLPPDLEADLKEIADRNERSLHGEMVYALRSYVEYVKRPSNTIETDTLFSQGRLYPWAVSCDGEQIAIVQADTGAHACDYICRTRWLSRLKLSAILANS